VDFAPDGEARAHRLAADLGVGDRVVFTGAYTQAAAPELYRSAEILLHTKVQDPCPTAVLEAMACGLPVVYAASGGTPELVGDDAGVGVDSPLDWDHDRPLEPAALADAVTVAANSLEAMGAAARARVEQKFDLSRWVARHREVFESLAR
jgi:glycosyltransferase involved in cell wall biosynthesis